MEKQKNVKEFYELTQEEKLNYIQLLEKVEDKSKLDFNSNYLLRFFSKNNKVENTKFIKFENL